MNPLARRVNPHVNSRLHWRMKWLSLCAPLLLWNGCFTEVGNPGEEDMTAVLRVATALEDSAGLSNGAAPDSVRISRLVLKLAGAEEYSSGKLKGTLWASQDGHAAAFTAGDTLPADRVISSQGIDSLVVRLQPYPAPQAFDLDTLRWEGFSGPGYVKGVYHRAGAARRFLFALPDSARFAPVYNRAALEAWRDAKGYHCVFLFRPRTWLAVPGLDSARAYAAAGGDSVVLFDAHHNASLYRALLRRFGKSFNDAQSYGVMPRSASGNVP